MMPIVRETIKNLSAEAEISWQAMAMKKFKLDLGTAIFFIVIATIVKRLFFD